MNANIKISQIHQNSSLMHFFFGSRSRNTLETILDLAKDKNELLDAIESTFDDVEDFDEMLHFASIDEIIERIGENYFIKKEENN